VWWPKNDGATVLQLDGSTQTSGWAIHKSTMGMDWLTNPEGFETYNVPWMNQILERNTDWKDIGGIELDPADPNVLYILMFQNAPAGIWRVKYDRAAGTIMPDETSWPGADRGFVSNEVRNFSAAVTKATHHMWVPDNGLIYFTWCDRVDPKTPGVIVMDRATGEVVEIMDYSDFYLVEYANSDGSTATYTPGPAGIDVDDAGIYTSAYWMASGPAAGLGAAPFDLPSFPVKRSFDGDIVWQNGNGDGFVDRFEGDEAAARGINPLDQLSNVNCMAGRWGVSFWAGYNNPQWGEVFGPDGAGLFKIMVDRMPPELLGEVYWVDNDSNIDGLYMSLGYKNQLVQWPFDVARAVISTGGPTVIAEVEAAGTPQAFALQGNYPNPFNPETNVRFAIPAVGRDVHAVVTIYNTTGQEVVRLVDGQYGAGYYKALWDGKDAQGRPVGSGVYLCNLTVEGTFSQTRQMTLVK